MINEIISYALSHLQCPAPTGTTHIEYAIEKWGTEELNNFNNYGWFQFSCVKDSMNKRKNLDTVLTQMGSKTTRCTYCF